MRRSSGRAQSCKLTLDGRAVPHRDVVAAEGGPEPSAATAQGELVDAVLTELEVGEETDARELDLPLAPAGAREENLYVAGERLAARAASAREEHRYEKSR